MKYGCIPIVTNSFALPEVVGGNGFIVKNKFECISAINSVMNNINFKINPSFNIAKRKAAFERLLVN